VGLFASKSKSPPAASEAELRFSALLRSQAFIEFSLEGVILGANDNFCRAMGYALDEIVGRNHSMFVDPAEAAGPGYREFWRKLNGGEFVADKFRRIGKGGREVWIRASYNPVLDAHGRPVKVMKIATDITEAEQQALRSEAARQETERAQAAVVAALGEALRHLSDGDLATRIHAEFTGTNAPIKADFNAAMSALQTAFSQISQTADPMRVGAEEIARAAVDLSRRTEQQASTLEETAAALDQITTTVANSTQGARQATTVAAGARTEAERSGEVVSRAVEAMTAIEQSSRKINDIIGVIDEIAFQTNLLALNAGVEAARAGDAGKGFAVVAQEVRSLAQRSGEAAKEIRELISSSREQVEHGVALVGATGEALSGLVSRAAEIDALISEIARSAEEQSTGLGQVNTAVNEMDKVTQQNAAMVEETSAAAVQLQERSRELDAALARFRLGDGGEGRRPEIADARRHAPAPNAVHQAQARLRGAP
jgi:methyl-accepting chemotaxis protein